MSSEKDEKIMSGTEGHRATLNSLLLIFVMSVSLPVGARKAELSSETDSRPNCSPQWRE